MFRNKKILIIIAVVISIGILTYSLWPKNAEEPGKGIATITTIPVTSKLGRVFVQDLHEIVNEETRLSIEKTLYLHMEKARPDLFTGIIRKDSYTKELLANSQTAVKFLVDIEPVQLTYSAVLTGRDDTYSITIRCAPQEQQINADSTCKDMLIL